MKKRQVVVVLVFLLIAWALVPLFARGAEESATKDAYVVSIARYAGDDAAAFFKAFREHVEKASDGRIVIEEHTIQALGSDRDVVEMCVHGEIQMLFQIMDGNMSGYMPSVDGTSLPFLFPDYMAFIELMNSPFFEKHQEFLLEESQNRIRILSTGMGSVRRISAKAPLRVPADLKAHNVRIRTMEIPLHMALWEALGAAAIALPSAERYMGLQTGIINAVEGGIASTVEMSLTDFVTHVIMSDHIISAVSTVINEEFYQTLPGDLQKVLVDGSRVASDMVNIRRPEIEEESVNAMREMGIEIVYPTAEEMAQWRSIAEPVGRRILGEKVNPRYFDMLTMAVDEVVDSR